MPPTIKSFSYDPEAYPDVHRWVERCLAERTLSQHIREVITQDIRRTGGVDEILQTTRRIEARLCAQTALPAAETGNRLPADVLQALDELGQ
jgi:hypothetical protein